MPKFIRIFLKIIRNILLFFFISSILAVVAYRWLPVYYTPLMFIRVMQNMSEGKPARFHHTWIPITQMPEHLPLAVMSSEDQFFLQHNGFDIEGIKKAAAERLMGKRFRGGSTISQQTAKNVFLWPSSTWVRKGFEAYFTFLIEHIWSKQRIMEVYLNSIEMGNNLYGASAVAKYHFGCSASELTRGDCALIAATLPNPRRFSSLHPSRYMYKRRRQILREMNWVERNMDYVPFTTKCDADGTDSATTSADMSKSRR